MTLVEVLRAAREKIAKGWCQGDYAQDEDGHGVPLAHPLATRYCSLGAIKVSAANDWDSRMDARSTLRSVLPKGTALIDWWNDRPGRTQAQVLALFDKAIRKAELESRGVA